MLGNDECGRRDSLVCRLLGPGLGISRTYTIRRVEYVGKQFKLSTYFGVFSRDWLGISYELASVHWLRPVELRGVGYRGLVRISRVFVCKCLEWMVCQNIHVY